MYLEQFFVEGLGHASYLIASDETNEAAIVDPRRDVEVYAEAARRHGFRLRYALETHNHNDYVSGAKALADRYGVEYVASAEAGLAFDHRGVREGDELRLGEMLIRVLVTPGHTPEHVTYVIVDLARADAPVLVFTGGDLLVGAVGRPDLLGRELGEKLAPLLYDSLHGKILKLEDYVEVLPTHGSGSLCGRGISSKRTTTIGYERRFNPALQKGSKREFVDFVLAGDPAIPSYYRRMRPTNVGGPDDWRAPEPHPLTPAEAHHLAGHNALVLDVRDYLGFGGGHVPGAVNVGLGPMLATWVGWLLPPDAPLVLVLDGAGDEEREWTAVATALARVGYERLAGYLQGGMTAWISAALPIATVPQWSVQQLRERLDADRAASRPVQVLDVRTAAEWDETHIAGATHLPLNDIPDRAGDLHFDPARPVAVHCGSGYRSSIATSLLLGRGLRSVVNVAGSMSAWQAAGYPTTQDEGEAERKAA